MIDPSFVVVLVRGRIVICILYGGQVIVRIVAIGPKGKTPAAEAETDRADSRCVPGKREGEEDGVRFTECYQL